jgi:uncharacterized damage-inducible protein DinB/predicted RNase H-like HicB family nuclease
MSRYSVYLEIGDEGQCMAHVLDLPGCAVRAMNREVVLHRLPSAIVEYYAWLRYHGETVPSEDEPIEIEFAEESTGFGPFNPGDAAALFSPDKKPVFPGEMEDYFRLIGYARDDLLRTVKELPEEVLDWQAGPLASSIRRLLRHIGNAEQWYVSRLVPSKTLPPEWEHDEHLPIFEFLEMERRTALERLRQLTDQERVEIFRPTQWTNHPEEPWTTRKVLRRFLEHEREHTDQIREMLCEYRALPRSLIFKTR